MASLQVEPATAAPVCPETSVSAGGVRSDSNVTVLTSSSLPSLAVPAVSTTSETGAATASQKQKRVLQNSPSEVSPSSGVHENKKSNVVKKTSVSSDNGMNVDENDSEG